MHQSFETPASPHSGLSGAFTFYPSESKWSLRSLGTTVSGAFPRTYCSTHTWYSLCKTLLTNQTHGLKDTFGSHEEVTSLSFEWPANKLQRLLNAQGMSKYLYCRSSFIDTSEKNTTDNWYRSANRTNNSRIEILSTDSVNSFRWLHIILL